MHVCPQFPFYLSRLINNCHVFHGWVWLFLFGKHVTRFEFLFFARTTPPPPTHKRIITMLNFNFSFKNIKVKKLICWRITQILTQVKIDKWTFSFMVQHEDMQTLKISKSQWYKYLFFISYYEFVITISVYESSDITMFDT